MSIYLMKDYIMLYLHSPHLVTKKPVDAIEAEIQGKKVRLEPKRVMSAPLAVGLELHKMYPAEISKVVDPPNTNLPKPPSILLTT